MAEREDYMVDKVHAAPAECGASKSSVHVLPQHFQQSTMLIACISAGQEKKNPHGS